MYDDRGYDWQLGNIESELRELNHRENLREQRGRGGLTNPYAERAIAPSYPPVQRSQGDGVSLGWFAFIGAVIVIVWLLRSRSLDRSTLKS